LDSPLFEIKDAVHGGGNPHFFFLPPMVPDASAEFTDAPFDGTHNPTVEICVWSGSECGPSLELYNMEMGPGSETMRVDLDAEQYIVNWHTEDVLSNFPLEEGEVYRIRVLVDVGELGHADVDVVENGKELKNVDTDEFIPLKDGRTLPIKFRIEEGALEQATPAVSAGGGHSCGLTTDGDAYCWGYNGQGALGTGYYSSSEPTPQLVIGGHTFQSVSARGFHTCGITTDGDAYCWGYDWWGQLGRGWHVLFDPTPRLVSGGHTFQTLSAGSYHTCGITTDGNAYCWGSNFYGKLGTGSTTNRNPSPQLVIGGHDFQTIEAARDHTCGLTTDGKIYCWGRFIGATPLLVTGGHTFQSVSAGGHTCGVATDGHAYCWGGNGYGQLGTGTVGGVEPNPVAVTGGHTFQILSAGWLHTCGVTTGGNAYCWGSSYHGQLGSPPSSPYTEPTPQLVTGGHTFRSVRAGRWHSCGVTTANDAFCWGRNNYGQVGDGTYTNQPSPEFVLDLDPPTP
jgi:alpha-tubulin suppressor-like RCC1 family protein